MYLITISALYFNLHCLWICRLVACPLPIIFHSTTVATNQSQTQCSHWRLWFCIADMVWRQLWTVHVFCTSNPLWSNHIGALWRTCRPASGCVMTVIRTLGAPIIVTDHCNATIATVLHSNHCYRSLYCDDGNTAIIVTDCSDPSATTQIVHTGFNHPFFTFCKELHFAVVRWWSSGKRVKEKIIVHTGFNHPFFSFYKSFFFVCLP